MARVGQQENSAANRDYSAEQKSAFNTGQREVGAFDRNVATLDRGGQVAANPWQSDGYLSNVNRLQSGALNSEENAGKEELQRNNLRTGGLNSGATIGATKGLALNKMRLGEQLSAERSAGDFNKNVGYQTQMAGMPLEGAHAASPYFGGAITGRSAALKNLTDYGMTSYGPWQAAIQGAGGAAGAYLKMMGGRGGDLTAGMDLGGAMPWNPTPAQLGIG